MPEPSLRPSTPDPALPRRQLLRASLATAAAGGVATAAGVTAAVGSSSLPAWSDPATWGKSGVPRPGSRVTLDFPVRLDCDISVAGLVVDCGGRLVLDPNKSVTIRSTGNVEVCGVLEMRPRSASVQHLLRFEKIDESAYVGGGMEPLASDVGLWVMHDGQLKLRGTPRRGWNRTGTHRTWRARDQVLRAPNTPGDYATYVAHRQGGKVPEVPAPDGSLHRTEVFNLTRNVRIEGTAAGRAHVFIHSMMPQDIRYVAFAHLGPRQPLASGQANSEAVLGRYPLHFHHCQDGSRGSIVQGCVVRDSSRAFVPHVSHGITMRDCVAYKIVDDAYWWDDGHETDDLTWERCAAFDVRHDPVNSGTIGAFQLGVGTGNVVKSCVAVGVHGHGSSGGFHWPSFANLHPNNTWVSQNLVAHNNKSDGIFVWQNDHRPHHVDGFVGYYNGSNGIQHGAYTNGYAYSRIKVWGNVGSDIQHMALSDPKRRMQTWDDVLCEHLEIGHHNRGHTVEESEPVVFRNLRCSRVTVHEAVRVNPGAGRYRLECAPGWDLRPADVDVVTKRSEILVAPARRASFRV